LPSGFLHQDPSLPLRMTAHPTNRLPCQAPTHCLPASGGLAPGQFRGLFEWPIRPIRPLRPKNDHLVTWSHLVVFRSSARSLPSPFTPLLSPGHKPALVQSANVVLMSTLPQECSRPLPSLPWRPARGRGAGASWARAGVPLEAPPALGGALWP